MDWQNHVCLLTGATGGIGQAIAKALAERGVTLILLARHQQQLNTLRKQLPGEHHILVADLSSPGAMADIAQKLAELPVPSMLINNAGVAGVGALEQLDPEQLQQTMQVNLLAPMALTQLLLPKLKQQRQAFIVNIGSTFGSIGFACHSSYCASKFGLRGFTESLYRELTDTPVKVCYLAPRATHTNINSQDVNALNKQLGNQVDSPEVVAGALMEQLQQGKPRHFIGFPERLFAPLNGVLPGVVDKALAKKLSTIKHYVGLAPTEVNS